MKWHYKIQSSFDPTDVLFDTSKLEGWRPYNTEKGATSFGESYMRAHNINPDQYYVKVFQIEDKPIDDIINTFDSKTNGTDEDYRADEESFIDLQDDTDMLNY